jgi:hypothetical protein
MKSSLAILLLLCSIIAYPQNGEPVVQLVHAKDNNIYFTKTLVSNDSITSLVDLNFGPVSLPTKKVKKIQPIYNSTILLISLGSNTKYVGNIINVKDSMLIFKLKEGASIQLSWLHIGEIEVIGDNDVIVRNPNSTRYFFAPSGIPLDKGTGYYQNAYILSNSVSFGLTNNFTMGGGVIIPLLFYVTPKISWEVSKNFFLGTGVIAATTVIPDAIVSGGIPYGVVTYGTTENNITIAGGYGLLWEEGDYKHLEKPIMTINGMVRFSDRIHLITENWIIPWKGTEEYEVSPEKLYRLD